MGIPVGALLKQWQSYVTTISRNMMELSEQTDVKLIELKVKDTVNGYTGLTKAKAEKAVEDLHTLWRYYSLLSDVVDKASILYSKDSFLNDTERKVRVLLENTPVILETEHIDISSRGLLSPENHNIKLSLQELLKLMQESFENIRNTFYDISHAVENIDRKLREIENEISGLKESVRRLGLTDMPSFDISKVEKIENDPLQGIAEIDAMYCSLENYKSSIKSAEMEYNKTTEEINSVKDMLREIEDLNSKSENAVLMSQKLFRKLYNARTVIDREVLASLNDWANVLEKKLSEGYLNAAKVGVQRLKSECAIKLDMARENYIINSSDYNEWLDLKGEFKALLAKMEGMKNKGTLFEHSTDDLIENIDSALHDENVNLINCRKLIERLRLGLKCNQV